MRIIYSFLVYIIIILSPLIIAYRIFKKKENPKRFLEKFSFNKEKRRQGKLIWFHCSSVGEFLSIVPIIQKFEKIKNINQILVTTSTLSSSKLFKNMFPICFLQTPKKNKKAWVSLTMRRWPRSKR